MKRLIENKCKILVTMLILVFSVFFLPELMVYAGESNHVEIEMDGYGTHEYPYLISNEENLNNLRDVIESGNSLAGVWFALTEDIDLQGEVIEPLVNQEEGLTFQGGFDGRGHKISNYVINRKDGKASFFGRMDGVVENLELDGTIQGKICSSFAQDGYGIIMNCISGSDLYAEEEASGIVNNWNGTLQNIVFQGNIVAPANVGIVKSGKGSATQIYVKNYKVGNIKVLDNYGTFYDNNGVQSIIDVLNNYAVQLFFTSEHAKWLNKWEIGEKIQFSSEVAAFKGTGTEKNPLIVDSKDKLEVLATFINAGYSFNGMYLYQTADIDLSGNAWTMLLDDSVAFEGIYDGNGHVIRNLNTEGKVGGLFKNFNGKIVNLKLENCQTNQGSGFAGSIGENALLLNCYCDGNISDTKSLNKLQQTDRLVNCYIAGLVEPSVDELNNGLINLIVNYGIHCGELYTWCLEDDIKFDSNYKDIYLEKDRMYWEGDGVEKNPYIISSIKDFVYLRECVYYNESFWRYWFKQVADIDFSEVYDWRAISDETSSNSFYGYYDGDGYKLQNFHTENLALTQSGTIFGNVSGAVFNVHVAECKIIGGGNGILAYNVSSTGNILNNIVELSRFSSVDSSLAIAYNNYGRIFNNIVVCPNTIPGVRICLLNGNFDDDLKVPEMDKNQIVEEINDSVVNKFNTGVLSVALHIKQRIINFNLLSINENDEYNLLNDVNLISSIGIKFIKGMLFNNKLLLLAVVWSIGIILFILYKIIKWIYEKRKIETRMLLQMQVVAGIYFAFVIAMYRLNSMAIKTRLAFAINTVCFCIFCGCSIIVFKRKKTYKRNFDLQYYFFKKYIPLVGSLIITTIIVVAHINMPIAYDADLYYGSFEQAIQNFKFSITGILDSFCIASKPMHGVAMLMTIGEAFDPGTARGVYICNLALLLLAQLCIYQIIEKWFPKLPFGIAALLSLCFSLSGYVIVGATYINPDFYSVVCFAIFLWCIVFEYRLFAIFSGFLVLCSKPNMIVAYLIFGGIYFIYECISKKPHIFKWLVYTLPASIYLILYFGIDSLNRAGVPTESQNEFIYTAGSRLLQYFAYGFIWIQEIFIIAMLIVLVKNKDLRIFKSKKSVGLFAIWAACLSQLLITIVGGATLQLCPRYLSVCAIKNIMLFALALEILPLKRKQIYTIVPTLTVLLFIQLFKTIDPSIIVTCDYKYDELYYLVFPKNDQMGNDLTFYNYEYCKDARYGSEILTTLSKDEIRNLYADNWFGYKAAIGSSSIYATYWDIDRKCRTYIPTKNCIRLKTESIIDGMTTQQEYALDKCVVVLRGENVFESIFSEESKQIGGFTIYYINEERK